MAAGLRRGAASGARRHDRSRGVRRRAGAAPRHCRAGLLAAGTAGRAHRSDDRPQTGITDMRRQSRSLVITAIVLIAAAALVLWLLHGSGPATDWLRRLH